MLNWIKKEWRSHTRSRTMFVSALGVGVSASLVALPEIRNSLEPIHYVMALGALSALNNWLRRVTTTSLDDK